MTRNDQKEQFSIAYARAVIATAGFKVSRQEVDDDSVDMSVAARGPMGTVRSPQIDLQLKCTASVEWEGDSLKFQLKLKNYEDLRHEDYQNPRILVVLTVPEKVEDWLSHSDDNLAMRHCGYWVSLRGKPPYMGTSTDTKLPVRLPRQQPFSVDQLKQLMAMVGRGEKP